MKSIQVQSKLARCKQRGQTMTEYAIIVALIALVCIGAIKLLGGQVSTTFTNATDQLEEANTTSE